MRDDISTQSTAVIEHPLPTIQVDKNLMKTILDKDRSLPEEDTKEVEESTPDVIQPLVTARLEGAKGVLMVAKKMEATREEERAPDNPPEPPRAQISIRGQGQTSDTSAHRNRAVPSPPLPPASPPPERVMDEQQLVVGSDAARGGGANKEPGRGHDLMVKVVWLVTGLIVLVVLGFVALS